MSIEAMTLPQGITRDDTEHGINYYTEQHMRDFARQAIAEAEKQEHLGTVVEYRTNFDFYRWGHSPYLNNAVNHWVVYTHPQPTESACDTPQYCKSVQRCTAADTYRGNQPKAEQDCFWKREGYKQCPNSQPKREWIGLTDEELEKVWPFVFRPHELSNKAIYQAIEAKLKEKNT